MHTLTHATPLAVVHRQAPAWLRAASPAARQQLKALLADNLTTRRVLNGHLAHLVPLDSYCAEHLDAAVRRWYALERYPDVRKARLSFVRGGISRTSTWLEAALGNFAYDETDSLKLFRDDAPGRLWLVDASRFATGCRSLDLGRQYRDHLVEHIDHPAFYQALAAHDKASLAVAVHIGQLRRAFSYRTEQWLATILAGHAAALAGMAVRCANLTLWGVPLDGPLLLQEVPRPGALQPCVLYLPGDSKDELREYPSLQALAHALKQRLLSAAGHTLFERYVGQAHRARFFSAVRQALYLSPSLPVADAPLPWGEPDANWLERLFYTGSPLPGEPAQPLQANPEGRLDLEYQVWRGDVFANRAQRHVERQLENAAALAVPTAHLDRQAQQALFDTWLAAGLNLLNLASQFIPGLAETMLGIWGAQVVEEVLDTVHAANEGDTGAVLEHLFDLLDTAIQAAALGLLDTCPTPAGPLDGWQAVQGPQGERLWHGQYRPQGQPPPWPATQPAAGDGLWDWGERRWALIDQQAYPVQRHGSGWRLAGERGYRPRLSGNGLGTWCVAGEQPLHWPAAQVLRRLCPAAYTLSDSELLQALHCSGLDEPQARRCLFEYQAPPARLLDSLERFGAAPAAPATTALGARLRRDFPGLSPRLAEALAGQASAAQRAQALDRQRLPVALGEAARLALRGQRLDRAMAGFYLPSLEGADTQRLALSTLPHLPGWSGQVAVQWREGGAGGRVLYSIGAAPAERTKVLTGVAGSYQPYDAQGLELAAAPNLFDAVLNALPDAERRALGYHLGEGATLRDAVHATLLQSPGLGQPALGLSDPYPLFRPPERFADGRLGYPLSGRGPALTPEQGLLAELYPGRSPTVQARLLAELREAAGPTPGALRRLLQRLRNEYEQLDHALQGWAHQAAGQPTHRGRLNLAEQLRMAWRRQEFGDDTERTGLLRLALEVSPEIGLPPLPVAFDHVDELWLNRGRLADTAALSSFLQAFPNIRVLDLTENDLSSLPPALAELPLRSLDLSSNSLAIGPADINILGRMPALRSLDVGWGVTGGIPAEALLALAHSAHLERFEATVLPAMRWTAAHFQAMARWPSLQQLRLGAGLVPMDAAAVAALSQLRGLRGLSITDLPLAAAPDLRGWNALETLNLSNTALTQWPTGIDTLLQRAQPPLRGLFLDRNQLVDTPDFTASPLLALAERSRQVGWHGEVVNLDGNNFSPEARQRLQGWGVLHDTPSSTQSSGTSSLLPPWYSEAGVPPGLYEAVLATQAEPRWHRLYQLLDQVQGSAEYELRPAGMRQRFLHVLEQLGLLPGEPAPMGLAEVWEHLDDRLQAQQASCDDQALYLFEQLELDLGLWRFAADAPVGAAASGEAAVLGGLGALRQHTLDEFCKHIAISRQARRAALATTPSIPLPALHSLDDITDLALSNSNAMPADDIELMLYARGSLRETLGLPAAPDQMRYRTSGWMSDAMLTRLGNAVTEQVSAERLRDWLLDPRQGFWPRWLRRLYPEAYAALAREWEGASEYFDHLLGEGGTAQGAYQGTAVPLAYVQALEHALPGIAWRRNGVLQNAAVSSGDVEEAGRQLLQARQAAERELMKVHTEALIGRFATLPGADAFAP